MKKIVIFSIVFFALDMVLFSCGQQRKKNNNVQEQEIEEVRNSEGNLALIESHQDDYEEDEDYGDADECCDADEYDSYDADDEIALSVFNDGINTPPDYTWYDENLSGRVKSFVEKREAWDGWDFTKAFDEKGRLVYYSYKPVSVRGKKNDAYPLSVPEQISFLYYTMDHQLLNPVHTTGLNEATFQYDDSGKITAVYKNKNELLYEFEYDQYGRLLSRLENGKPRMKIIWDDSQGVGLSTFKIKFYTPEGYDDKVIKYGWKSPGLLAKIWSYPEEYFITPEYTFYNYPQVKTVRDESGDEVYWSYYIYNTFGIVDHVVKFNNRVSSILYGPLHCSCVCTSYKYNEYGDVIFSSKWSVDVPYNGEEHDFFVNYFLNYDYYHLPAFDEETVWRYVYDDHGNWIKKEQYKVIHGDIDIENLEETTTREYEYYE